LADLVGAVPERLRRHRRDRHGVADVAGNFWRQADRPSRAWLQRAQRRSESRHCGDRRRLCRPVIAVQHRRPIASLSDYIGRKNTYYTFFILGIALYASAPFFAQIGNKALFVLAFGIILSMYGGGFATVPAYLADMFGTQFVGAIHGRLLTAWSTAGIIGPVVVNYIREAQLAAGVPRDHLYDFTMYILCGMLIIGLICNFLVKPVNPKWFMSQDEIASCKPQVPAARHIRDRSGSARADSTGRLHCSGLSSAFRSLGVCGSQ
jgi:MFS family permease